MIHSSGSIGEKKRQREISTRWKRAQGVRISAVTSRTRALLYVTGNAASQTLGELFLIKKMKL